MKSSQLNKDQPVPLCVTPKGKVAIVLRMLRSWHGFTGDDEMTKMRRLLKEALADLPNF